MADPECSCIHECTAQTSRESRASHIRKTDIELRKMDRTETSSDSTRVGILAVEGFPLMSYSCTVEPLRAANLLAHRQLYEVIHFGSRAEVASSGVATVPGAVPLDKAARLDLLMVVAGGDPFAFRNQRVFAWLRDMADKDVRIGGVSGGPVLLANAGLMKGRRMTVHWEHAQMLEERVPNVIIEQRLFVMDRDRVTCGGGTSPLDLMHAIIAERHGASFAGMVSDWFLHTDIRGEHAPQRQEPSFGAAVGSRPVKEAVEVMESHAGDPLSLAQLALVVGVTPRHLNRLFVDRMGISVMEYYRRQRLALARRLVRNSAMRVAQIADATGFSNAGHFSNAYLKAFGVRPHADRTQSVVRGA